jgi:tripartite-type tricarboxylate transporter receptor subunit TctC
MVAQHLEAGLGRPVTPLNMDVALEAYTYLAQAPADGSVIGLVAADIAALHHRIPGIIQLGNLTPLALLATDPAAIHVRVDGPLKTASEILDAARREPGRHKLSGPGTANIWHLSGVRWLTANAVAPAGMPWLGAESPRAAAGDLVQGQADAVICSIPEVRASPAGRRIRTVGVMSQTRHVRFPGVPTVGTTGRPLSAGIWRGLAGPKGMTPAMVSGLTDRLRRTHAVASYQSAMLRKGFMLRWADGAEFASFASSESAAMGNALRSAGLG